MRTEPDYTPELAIDLCERIAEGASLARVCKIEGMPRYRTVRRWELTNKEFAQQMRIAREISCHIMAEECLDIADSVQDYTEVTKTEDGKVVTRTYNNMNQSRLRIDTRLRLIGKWLPRVYGDKVDLNHSGGVKIDKITRRIVWPGQPGLPPPLGATTLSSESLQDSEADAG